MSRYRQVLLIATLLAVGVIGLGAFVRLSDAGLGCPDWPGCYGHWLGVPDSAAERQAAAQAFPARPVEIDKAWREMLHRYLAGLLGLLVLVQAVLAWRRPVRQLQSPVLATLLLLLVCLQVALGMWTVTLLLKPVIVTLHLLGGMATLAILVALLIRQASTGPVCFGAGFRSKAALALIAVILQIVLGGWVSSNYAALACPDFPLCRGDWRVPADFAQAFMLYRELGQTAQGAALSSEALAAIHWAHRVGALVVIVLVLALARALFVAGQRRWCWLLLAALALQLGLGIANVLLSLPLALAVAHNLGAALLLSIVTAINIRSRSVRQAAIQAAEELLPGAHPGIQRSAGSWLAPPGGIEPPIRP